MSASVELRKSADHSSRAINRRAGIVGLGTFTSRAFGLCRDLVLASRFTIAQTDAFWIAFTIPNLLRQLVAEGAVQSAVIPVLAKVREQEGEARAQLFFRYIRGLSTLALLVLTLLGVFFAPELVSLFASGFRESPEQHERTVTLTRWLFPYLLTVGTVALGVAALNTHQRFVVTAFTPLLLNVAFIVCALSLSGVLKAYGYDTVFSLAAGALLGGVLQVLAQLPSLRAIGYSQRPALSLKDPAVVDVLKRMGPILIGIGIYYIDVIVGRRLLSELGVGAVSYFNFALRLCDFPQGIFVMALQAATLPSLAALLARNDQVGAATAFSHGLRLALFVGLAASAFFIALAQPLVAILYQRGHFGSVEVAETAKALMAQGVGIAMVACVRQLVSAFYAAGDTRTPVVISGVDLLVFIGAALLLRDWLGHVAISLAISVSSTVQMLLLFWRVRGRLPELDAKPILASFAKSLVAAAFAGVSAHFMSAWSSATFAGESFLPRVVPVFMGSLVFGLIFLVAAYGLKSSELLELTASLGRRLSRRARNP